MKKFLLITGLAVSLVMIVISVLPASTAMAFAPRIKDKAGTSTNWSGYAVQTSITRPQNGAVTYVTGTWQVPSVQSTSGTSNTYSSAWVGIDGYSDNTVEQLGTDQNWINGRAVYDAWYEMYPKYPFAIPLTITAGDSITATVTNNNGRFTLTMTDNTTGKSYSTTQNAKSAKSNSAEWIMEAPWSGGVLPLSNFGIVNFSNCTATLNKHTGTISDLAWQSDAITMASGSTVKALPSALTSGGSAFSVTWYHQ